MSEEKDVPQVSESRSRHLPTIIGKAHPSYLAALRETQPLASLASFSIVIAAFSGSEPQAQQYALVAGFMFLVSFLCSTAVSMGFKSWVFETYSYISTTLGVLFLVLVLWQFAAATRLLNSALAAIAYIYAAAFTGLFSLMNAVPEILRLRKPASRSGKWRGVVAIYLVTAGLGVYIIIANSILAAQLLLGETTASLTLLPITLFGAFGGILIGKAITRRRTRPPAPSSEIDTEP